MDPLSIVASCIAVLGAGGTAIRGLQKLSDLRNVPAVLMAVMNEIADLTFLVQEIKTIFQAYQDTLHASNVSFSTEVIAQLFDRAQAVLLDLDQVINYQILVEIKRNSQGEGKIIINRSAWLRKERHVCRLQERLRTVRLDLATGLTALNLSSTLRVEVMLQNLRVITGDIRDSQNLSEEDQQNQRTTQLATLHQVLGQSYVIQENQSRTDDTLRLLRDELIASRISKSSIQDSRQYKSLDAVLQDSSSLPLSYLNDTQEVSGAVSIKVSHIRRTRVSCSQGCACTCHMSRHGRTPQIFQDIIGSLFLGYSSIPVFTPKCDNSSCSRYSHSQISAIFIFPQWLLHRLLSIVIINTRRDGPELNLKTMRVRPASDIIFYLSQTGDLIGIQRLFERGEASPFDVGLHDYRSILHIAVGALQFDVCKFLIQQGADPNFSVGGDQSPATQAWSYIFSMNGDATLLAAFGKIFDIHDCLESRQLTTLHKIILGLEQRNLKDYLQICSKSEVDRIDKAGRTALNWAAIRADLGAVQNLLKANANPNILDRLGAGALHMATWAASPEIVRCLLEARAQVNLQGNSHRSTPLLTTLQSPSSVPGTKNHQAHLTCMRLLINAGADVDVHDWQGATAMIFASQWNNLPAVEALLRSRADINKSNSQGETALVHAVQANSHESAQLLLSNGADYTLHTKRRRSILHEAAEYGNLKTLQILTSARIRGLHVDEKDSQGNTPWQISKRRTDESSEWHAAFTDLLASVDERYPKTTTSSAVLQRTYIYWTCALAAVSVTKSAITRIYDIAKQINEEVCKFPRTPTAVLPVVLVLLVAVVWYIFR